MKHTRKALFASVISMLLCVTMLIGSTFAWFTDTVSSGVNTIVAGNLDIEVSYLKKADDGTSLDAKEDSNWATLQDATSLFSSNLWEPGHTEFVTLKIENKGTLAFNYKMMVTPVDEYGGINVAGDAFKLSDYLYFGTTTPNPTQTVYANREDARKAIGTTTNMSQESLEKMTQVGTFEAGGNAQYVTLVVYMPETVGNEANYRGTAPTIDLGIQVLATQLTSESDSFNNQYDKDAKDDAEYAGVGPYYEYFEAVVEKVESDESGLFNITKTDTSNTLIASASGTAATAGGKVKLTVTKSKEAETNFTADVQDGYELNGYDINVVGHKPDSLVQMQLFVGIGLQDFKFYHDGTAMTSGNNGSLADGEYYYDAPNGYVYFATTSFSPFQATYKTPEAAIGDTVYGTLAAAIANANNGDTITLTDGERTMPAVSNKNITITGTKNAVLTLDKGVSGSGSTITFDGITIQGYAPSNSDDWHTEQLKHAQKLTYKNCDIIDLITTYAPSDFENCVFTNNSTSTADWYSVFAYVDGCSIKGCTFNTTASKAIKLFNEGPGSMTLTVTDCVFNGSIFDKAAVEIDSQYTDMYYVSIKDCKINSYYTKLWNDKYTNPSKVVVSVDGHVQLNSTSNAGTVNGAFTVADKVEIDKGTLNETITVPADKEIVLTNTTIATSGTGLDIKGDATLSNTNITAEGYNNALNVSAGNTTFDGGTVGAYQVAIGGNQSDDATLVINEGTFNLEWGFRINNDSIIKINGGSFNCDYSLVCVDNGVVNMTITGGTFNMSAKYGFNGGTISGTDWLTITGGTFNIDPTQYVDTDAYDVTNRGNMYTVIAK